MHFAQTAHGESTGSILDEISQTIIHHVANSDPLIILPKIGGIDFSLTKHVIMLWITAGVVFALTYLATSRHRKEKYPVPTGFGNAIETVVARRRGN